MNPMSQAQCLTLMPLALEAVDLVPPALRDAPPCEANGSGLKTLDYPGAPLPLESPLYISRPVLEDAIYQELLKPGSVIRIQAPRQMGKSSLLNRVLAHAQAQHYRAVYIDFKSADASIYSSLDRFLRWLCVNVSRRLQVTPCLDQYWDTDCGSKISCSLYFEYLISQIDSPIVLVLNEVDQVFQFSDIAKDFLLLLRYWHEQAKQVASFRNLRLVIAHSTEPYISLNIHQSPLNIGLPIQLPELSFDQALILANNYGLNWAMTADGKQDIQSVYQMVGGNPYRLSKVYYYLHSQSLTLSEILATAAKSTGIFASHLQDLMDLINPEASLKLALWQVVSSQNGHAEIDLTSRYKLDSLGLVHLQGNYASPSCELYRLYFREQLASHFLSQMTAPGKLIHSNQALSLISENSHFSEIVKISTRPILGHSQANKTEPYHLPQAVANERMESAETVFPQIVDSSQNRFTAQSFANILGGRYRIVSAIGRGGFGQTYLAEDMHRPSNPRCVVKKLAGWFSPQKLTIARRLFATEAKTLEKLGMHAQIPQLLASFEQSGEFYLVQELIDGQLLRDEMLERGKWNEPEIIVFLQDILPILEFAHQHRVIHRDIKPENLIRRHRDGKLVLIDFGVAKFNPSESIESEEHRTVAISSCGYTPWEQCQGNPHYNSDIYAVGMIAIEGATGCHPERLACTYEELDLQWQALTPSLSPAIAKILARMVRCNYKERYSSVREILRDLEHEAPTNLGFYPSQTCRTQKQLVPSFNYDAG